MTTDRFLTVYGWALLIFGSVGGLFDFYIILIVLKNQSVSTEVIMFVAIMTTWYVVTGIGILRRTRWGYYLLKSILYLLFLSFPIGTFISYKSLKFMKKNSIKYEFST
jgi:Zn-dependent protease with chaperone function